MDTHEFHRQFWLGVFEGAVKGLYQMDPSEHPLDPDCLGSWMTTETKNMRTIHKKWKDDKWSVTEAESNSWWGSMVHIYYKNRETCNIEKIGDDMKHWSLENPALSIDQENIVERLMFESGPIMGKMLDLYDMWQTHDPCENDALKIARTTRWVQDVTTIKSKVLGISVNWDDKPTHIKKTEWRKEYHKLKKEFPHRNIMA